MSNQDKKDTLKGELVAFGADNYLHDPAKSMNYYAQIKKDDGTISERWGKDLESVIKDSGVQVGDTVVLAELGKEPVVVGDKTFHKTIWDLQKYEPALELPNAIEHDTQREQQQAVTADKTKENEENAPSQPKKTPNLSDFEFELPSNIKNNYIAIVKNRHLSDQKINYYDKDDKDQVNIAFEDRNKSLHTSRQDEKTIYAMLDMAQSKGWSDIKLKGTEEFKQKVWLEASLRGIGVKGYEPNEKDLAELQAKQAERTTNQVEMTAPYETKKEQKLVKDELNYKEIAKDVAIEAGAVAVTPAPLQPVIAGAFLAKDVVSAGEFLQEKVDTKLKSDKELTKELKKEVTQIFQNGYKDGTVTNLDGLIRELKERGYEVKENDKSIRVTDKNGTAITVKNEPFTKVFDAVKSLKDELKPETIKANYPNIDDVNIANITAYKNYLLEQFKTPQALEKSLSELNQGVKDLANGKSINFPTLPPNEERPVIDVRVPESGEKSRIKS